MAEAFAFSSGVVGIVSLGIQVTQGLVKYYSEYRDLDITIKRTTSRIQSLLVILREVEQAIAYHRSRDAQHIIDEVTKWVDRCEDSILELEAELVNLEKPSSDSIRSKLKSAGYRLRYPFDKPTLERLDGEIAEIRENISLALNILQLRSQEVTHNEISEIKPLLELLRSDQISEKIRNWLNAPNTISDHHKAISKRHPGTGSWLIQGAAFQEWLIKDNSLLWLNGFAGCGKSVLCSTAIEHALYEKQTKKNVGVAFFLFSFQDKQRRDEVAMLRVLLLQLASQLSEGGTILKRLYDENPYGAPPAQQMIYSLRYLISKFDHAYILIDAVDESPLDEYQEHVLDAISEIRHPPIAGLHFLLTSRDEPYIHETVMDMGGTGIVLRNPQVDEDMARFIRWRLKADSRLRKWDEFKDRIIETLAERADGVFKWVECQLTELKNCPCSEEHLDDCLNSLPSGLRETYARILCAIPERSFKEARRMLMLLCYAGRPLAEAEILDGVAVSLDDPVGVNYRRRLKSWRSLRDICPDLIDISSITKDPSSGSSDSMVARIAHFSVQEYLEFDAIRDQNTARFAINAHEAHTEIAQICCAYLQSPGLPASEPSQKTLLKYPLASFAAIFWNYHYQHANSAKEQLQDHILKVFQYMPAFQTWVSLQPGETLAEISAPGGRVSPTFFAAWLGLEYVVRHLMDANERHNCVAGSAASKLYGNALEGPARTGREDIVQMLLDNGADVDYKGRGYGSPLCTAAYYGHERVVELFLKSGADMNVEGGFYGNPLYAAAEMNHTSIVEMLLKHGANINARRGGSSESTVLEVASRCGNEEIVRILLERGVDVNAQAGPYGSALQSASSQGYESIVKMLLDGGAEVNAQQSNGAYRNALQAASAYDQLTVVELLLARGADVNMQGGYHGNALFAASEGGHEKVVELLLKNNADVNAQGGYCGCALVAASILGASKVVRTLLEHGADVNISVKDYGKATDMAGRMGHDSIMEMLLEHGAASNDREGRVY